MHTELLRKVRNYLTHVIILSSTKHNIVCIFQDELEFRHKTLPISVEVDLYSGEKRTIEV